MSSAMMADINGRRAHTVVDKRWCDKLVPKRVSEAAFWRNYFSHVFAVKRRFELGSGAAVDDAVGGEVVGDLVVGDPLEHLAETIGDGDGPVVRLDVPRPGLVDGADDALFPALREDP